MSWFERRRERRRQRAAEADQRRQYEWAIDHAPADMPLLCGQLVGQLGTSLRNHLAHCPTCKPLKRF